MFDVGDTVCIKALLKNNVYVQDSDNLRRPQVGDIARVCKVYTGKDKGYQLRCNDGQGARIWLLNFSLHVITLERVRRASR